MKLAAPDGFEPPPSGSEPEILPLNYRAMVLTEGLEPSTYRLQGDCTTIVLGQRGVTGECCPLCFAVTAQRVHWFTTATVMKRFLGDRTGDVTVHAGVIPHPILRFSAHGVPCNPLAHAVARVLANAPRIWRSALELNQLIRFCRPTPNPPDSRFNMAGVEGIDPP